MAAVRQRVKLRTAIHILVSGALITWLAYHVDWSEFAHTVQGTDTFYLAVSMAISPFLVLVRAWKWKILLRARSLDTTVLTCFNYYLIGQLFNHILPTVVGGDVIRGTLMSKRLGNSPDVVAALVLERFTGLSALVAMGIIVMPFGASILWDINVKLFISAIGLAYAGLVWFLLSKGPERLTARWAHSSIVRNVLPFHQALQSYKNNLATIGLCLLLSIGFYIGAAVNIQISAMAFGAELTFVEALMATPVILMFVMLPISLGGVGLSEWAYVFALGRLGIPSSIGLSTALLMRAKATVLGLVGGVVHLFVGRGVAPAKSREYSPSSAQTAASRQHE